MEVGKKVWSRILKNNYEEDPNLVSSRTRHEKRGLPFDLSFEKKLDKKVV